MHYSLLFLGQQLDFIFQKYVFLTTTFHKFLVLFIYSFIIVLDSDPSFEMADIFFVLQVFLIITRIVCMILCVIFIHSLYLYLFKLSIQIIF